MTTVTNGNSKPVNGSAKTKIVDVEEDTGLSIPKSRFVFTDIFVDSISYSVLIFVFLFSSYMNYDAFEMQRKLSLEPEKPDDYLLPTWNDLIPSIYCLGGIFIVNKLFFVIFKEFVKNRLTLVIAEENNNELAELYIKKSCVSIFKFFFYLTSTIFGYYTLKDTGFLPTNFFGNGAFSNIFKEEYPTYLFWKRPEHLYLYINLNLAFSMFDLLEVLLNPLQTDFLIMIIHHLSTISLIIFSTLTNNSHVGSMVIFLHFYGDIYSYIVRSILYLDINDIWKGISCFLFLINFAYSRVYVFSGWLYDISKGIRHTWFFFENWLYVFLYFLLILHLLWTFMIGKKFLQYLLTGKIVDIAKVKKK